MKIKDILAKVKKGEKLTDEEQAFLDAYDPDTAVNDAAAAARRKAEKERDDAKAEADKLRKEKDDAAAANLTEQQKKDAAFKELQETVAGLTKSKTEAETRAATVQRSQAIRDAAKAAGIALAPKTVNEGLFHQMIEITLSGVDVNDKAALTAALEKFKSENGGIIIAPGSGTGVKPGDPSYTPTGVNPWKKETENITQQTILLNKDPAAAKAMAAEAGVVIP